MRQNTETQLSFAMFDFAKLNMDRQNSDDGPSDCRRRVNRAKIALSTASTKMRAHPGSGQTN